MTVCQFFLRGTCKFGDSCRNEHPAQQSAFGGNSWNRNTTTTTDAKISLPFNAGNIAQDLTPNKEKPTWPLSSYGPSKHEPLLLAGLDESPEELRVKAVTALKAGNMNEYLQYESSKISAAEQIFENARINSDQAYQQAVKQSKLPALIAGATGAPATNSTFGGNSGSAFPSTSSAFGNKTTATPSAFGNATTSAFGTTTTPSAFGTSTTTPSTFGKPAFGQSAFGQQAFGQPAFGQTSAPGSTTTTGAFGQPLNNAPPVSAFSQPQQSSTSVFGQPSQGAPTSAFGQPSAFGQATSTPSVIKPATGAFSAFSGTPSPFGAANNATNTPASTVGSGFSAFSGQASAFGLGAPSSTNNQQSAGSVFGQPTNPPAAPSVFGTPAQGSGSVFGAQSAFGVQAQGAFGVGGSGTTTPLFNTNPSSTSVFGQSAFSDPSKPTLSAFPSINTTNTGGGAPMSTTPIPQSGLSAFGQSTPSISMEMKTPTVSATPLDFTASNPVLNAKEAYKPGSTPYDQQLPQRYGEMLPKAALEAFQAARFEWGKVPEWVPPLNVR